MAPCGNLGILKGESSQELCAQTTKVDAIRVIMKKCREEQSVVLHSFNSTQNDWSEWLGLASSLRLAVFGGYGVLTGSCRAVGTSK